MIEIKNIKNEILFTFSHKNLKDAIEEIVKLKCNLKQAYLTRADLEGANLEGATLTKANLGGANLIGAYLIRANLFGAYLTRAYLYKANLEGVLNYKSESIVLDLCNDIEKLLKKL